MSHLFDMLNRYLRLIIISITFLTAALLLIQSQPYDDHGLRDLLLPPDCSAPCFMGIRPAVTTQDEAVRLLKSNVWVKQVEPQFLNTLSGYITWTWSDLKPIWIDGNAKGEIRAGDQLVTTITIYSKIPLGDTRLALGMPDAELVEQLRDSGGPFLLYLAFYDRRGMLVESLQPCEATDPLQNQVTLNIGPVSSTHSFMQTLAGDQSLRDLYHPCR